MLQLVAVALLSVAEPVAGDTGAPPPPPPSDAPRAPVVLAELPAAPAGEPTPPPMTEAEHRDGPRPEFVKGELSVYLGSDRLTVKNTRIGVSAGIDRFADAYYVLVEPLVDLRFFDGKLGIGLGVPLRLELVNLQKLDSDPFANLGKLRAEDWNTVHDFGRVLKYVTFGRKEDNLYVSAGQRYASSIGHGAITRRYSPNINIDYPRASAQVDMYNDYGGFELMTNDLLEWNQLAGLAFIKPFSFFKPQSLMLRTFSVGVTAATDWRAPWELSTDQGVRRVDAEDLPLTTARRPVGLVGIDAEMKVVKTAAVDLKPYLDVSVLLGGDAGATLGVLGRFNLGQETVHAFRLVAEARYLGSRYAPSYFDTFYEVDRFAYLGRDVRVDPTVGAGLYVPKHRWLLERGLGNRVGYYLEGSWGVRNVVGLTLALEGTSANKAVNFVAHLELPVLSFLQLFGSYYLRGVESWDELGQKNGANVAGLFGEKAITFAGARVRLLPFLFINGRVYKTFRVNTDLGRFDNQFGFVVDLEVGYEFRKPEPSVARAFAPESEGSALGRSALR